MVCKFDAPALKYWIQYFEKAAAASEKLHVWHPFEDTSATKHALSWNIVLLFNILDLTEGSLSI